MADLIINGKDALKTWGVRMGDGFIDAIGAPSTMKDSVSNKSRLEHGTRYDDSTPKLEERDLTLTVTIKGNDKEDFKQKKKSFFEELYAVKLDISVPADSDEIYHLRYTGKSVTYNQNISRTFAKIAVKFNEPNPFLRGEE